MFFSLHYIVSSDGGSIEWRLAVELATGESESDNPSRHSEGWLVSPPFPSDPLTVIVMGAPVRSWP